MKYKYYTNIKSIDEESRVVRFIASTEDVDRDNEKVLSTGWKLDSYKKNPVVLWAHNYTELPIGRADVWIDKDAKALMADITFAEMEQNSKADSVFKMVKSGVLNAVSVGFSPNMKKAKFGQTEKEPSITFEEQELLEISVVPVPANRNAIATSKSIENLFNISKEKNVLDDLEINELREDVETFIQKCFENDKKDEEIVPENEVSDINTDTEQKHICSCCGKELNDMCSKCKEEKDKEDFFKKIYEAILNNK
jgi:HK97 family phage prohead protease